MYQAGSVLCEKSDQFELVYLFWPVVCNMQGRLRSSKILSRNYSKNMYA